MRVPRVSERWTQHDGRRTVTVQKVYGTPVRVAYRYDDGVESDKLLTDFHLKFKDPQPASEQCPQIHTPTGLRCVGMKDHDGPHLNGLHEWTAAPKHATGTKVVLSKPAPASAPLVTESYIGPNTRAHIKAYYGYDPIDSNPTQPKQGNWEDPEYRAKYMGFKK